MGSFNLGNVRGGIGPAGSGGGEATRTPIPITIDGDFTIANWQTNIVPNDPLARTYVQRFGNVIKDVKGMQDVGGGAFTLYSPSEVKAVYSGENITTVIIYTVFIGNISII